MTQRSARAEATRNAWKAVLEKFHEDRDGPLDGDYWSEKDTWSRERIREVQDEKIAAVAPFLYENSDFYRRRFDRLGDQLANALNVRTQKIQLARDGNKLQHRRAQTAS